MCGLLQRQRGRQQPAARTEMSEGVSESPRGTRRAHAGDSTRHGRPWSSDRSGRAAAPLPRGCLISGDPPGDSSTAPPTVAEERRRCEQRGRTGRAPGIQGPARALPSPAPEPWHTLPLIDAQLLSHLSRCLRRRHTQSENGQSEGGTGIPGPATDASVTNQRCGSAETAATDAGASGVIDDEGAVLNMSRADVGAGSGSRCGRARMAIATMSTSEASGPRCSTEIKNGNAWSQWRRYSSLFRVSLVSSPVAANRHPAVRRRRRYDAAHER